MTYGSYLFYRVCPSLGTHIIHNFSIKIGQDIRYIIQIIIF